MVVFTVVFGHIAKLSSGDTTPYALMVYGGLLPWTLFASVFGDASASVMSNANLISKVYFPRLIEMGSESYLAQPHGHKDSVASGSTTGLVET